MPAEHWGPDSPEGPILIRTMMICKHGIMIACMLDLALGLPRLLAVGRVFPCHVSRQLTVSICMPGLKPTSDEEPDHPEQDNAFLTLLCIIHCRITTNRLRRAWLASHHTDWTREQLRGQASTGDSCESRCPRVLHTGLAARQVPQAAPPIPPTPVWTRFEGYSCHACRTSSECCFSSGEGTGPGNTMSP